MAAGPGATGAGKGPRGGAGERGQVQQRQQLRTAGQLPRRCAGWRGPRCPRMPSGGQGEQAAQHRGPRPCFIRNENTPKPPNPRLPSCPLRGRALCGRRVGCSGTCAPRAPSGRAGWRWRDPPPAAQPSESGGSVGFPSSLLIWSSLFHGACEREHTHGFTCCHHMIRCAVGPGRGLAGSSLGKRTRAEDHTLWVALRRAASGLGR